MNIPTVTALINELNNAASGQENQDACLECLSNVQNDPQYRINPSLQKACNLASNYIDAMPKANDDDRARAISMLNTATLRTSFNSKPAYVKPPRPTK